MGLVYKDLMGKMGIDDEGLFELAYCELDYISNELQKIYKSPYISDLNSYIYSLLGKCWILGSQFIYYVKIG